MKWSESDIQPSMVTHTRNLWSKFTHPSAHTQQWTHTHTPWTHTRSSGQPFMLRRPGSSWGFGALLEGTSVVVLRVERALNIHSPHRQSLPDQDSNSQPLDYKSNSLPLGHTFRRNCKLWYSFWSINDIILKNIFINANNKKIVYTSYSNWNWLIEQ